MGLDKFKYISIKYMRIGKLWLGKNCKYGGHIDEDTIACWYEGGEDEIERNIEYCITVCKTGELDYGIE